MKCVDLSKLKRITASDAESAGKNGATELLIRKGCALTPSAQAVVQRLGIVLKIKASASSAAANGNSRGAGRAKPRDAGIERLFNSAEAGTIKEEICSVGHKLWMRSYVDGNGGNISYRIAENAVICTPTLLSKADLKPGDLCMVDLEGKQLAGVRQRTSEIFLHLEIFKQVPQAKAVVHCHPPHATAYAITGRVPPPGIIPEFDVFVGSVAFAPYETPGTQKFAETVIPFVKSHNTVLLGNHGIVCWADTPTHAEWHAENLETYCWTLLISKQLGAPYARIPLSKERDLLAIKKRLGLPDARFNMKECVPSEIPEHSGAIALVPPAACGHPSPPAGRFGDAEAEAIVKAVTDAVMAAIKRA
jgi:L-fuculose-phosphate aldolase